jgi:hypothetical protein
MATVLQPGQSPGRCHRVGMAACKPAAPRTATLPAAPLPSAASCARPSVRSESVNAPPSMDTTTAPVGASPLGCDATPCSNHGRRLWAVARTVAPRGTHGRVVNRAHRCPFASRSRFPRMGGGARGGGGGGAGGGGGGGGGGPPPAGGRGGQLPPPPPLPASHSEFVPPRRRQRKLDLSAAAFGAAADRATQGRAPQPENRRRSRNRVPIHVQRFFQHPWAR